MRVVVQTLGPPVTAGLKACTTTVTGEEQREEVDFTSAASAHHNPSG